MIYPQKSHRRASAEAIIAIRSNQQASVPLGPSAGVQGAKVRNKSQMNKKKTRIFFRIDILFVVTYPDVMPGLGKRGPGNMEPAGACEQLVGIFP